jgi:RNA polymerase sigma-70 factor (TIGR02960 family)
VSEDVPVDFDQIVAEHRRGLYAHCYRMLGSVQDAEDAVQEAMLAAWRGLDGFQGRSSLRTWLYRITTHVCLRMSERRRPRVLTPDLVPSRHDTADLGVPLSGPVFLEPLVEEAAEEFYLRREDVELAFIAALQYLPANQRAVLLLRDVLEFSAADVAELLDTTTAAVNSALQRARKSVRDRVARPTQQEELAALGDDGVRELVGAYMTAWERADVPALVDLLADDARFTMPPLPAWFDGRADVARFLAERLFASAWRLVPITANGQPAFACYQRTDPGGPFRLAAVNVLTVRNGLISEITGFIDPALHRFLRFLPERR